MWETHEQKNELFQNEALIYMDALFNSALKLTYNEQDANDLVQETYFKAYRFFDQYKQGTSCKAWLYTILKNTFINKYRRKTKKPDQVGYDAIEPFVDLIKDSQFKGVDTPDDIVINDYLSDEVDEALTKLPYDFRMVLILSDIEGFSYKEIADILSCPIGTVRSRLSRARKMMCKYLQNYAKQEGFYHESVQYQPETDIED